MLVAKKDAVYLQANLVSSKLFGLSSVHLCTACLDETEEERGQQGVRGEQQYSGTADVIMLEMCGAWPVQRSSQTDSRELYQQRKLND